MLKHLLAVLLPLFVVSAAFAQPPNGMLAPKMELAAKPEGGQKHDAKKHKLTDTVGVVNGQVIRLYDFRNALSENIEHAAEQGEIKGDSVTAEGMTAFVDQTWNEILDDILLEGEIYKRHLSVNDSEALNYLIASPSPAQREEFSDSTGKFNPRMLRSALQDPANDSVVSIILAATKLDLEHEKLLKAIGGKAKTTKAMREAMNVWLREQRAKALIVDNRTAFGYY